MPVFEVTRGNSPIVFGLPHTGLDVPRGIWARLNENGRILADTDWHVERLVAELHPGVTVVRATTHRYVIDANRDPGGSSLYPGQNTTGLIPTTDFDGQPIWCDGDDLADADVADRVAEFHAPYHRALDDEIRRVHAMHGVAVLIDFHSIRSRIPFLFEGALPDLNVGTYNGASCDAAVEKTVTEAIARSTYSSVLNGRFKGGWTTRHYGQPATNIHAIQIEIAQSAYLQTENVPFDYSVDKSSRLRDVLASAVIGVETTAFALRPSR